MKTFHRLFLAFVLLGAMGMLSAASPFEAPGENDGITINQNDVLVFPFSMTLNGILTGAVRAVVSVDANGQLSDVLVVGYTNVAFADAAVSALKRWTYEPSRIHGVPRSARAYVLFDFKNDIGVMMQGLPGTNHASIFQKLDERYVYSACQLRELDHIPTPAHVVPPAPPKAGLHAKRTVTVEFYIDEEGRVRMPAIGLDEVDDAYAAAAVAAVEQWHFEPPTRRGHAVLVLARQDFNFVPKS